MSRTYWGFSFWCTKEGKRGGFSDFVGRRQLIAWIWCRVVSWFLNRGIWGELLTARIWCILWSQLRRPNTRKSNTNHEAKQLTLQERWCKRSYWKQKTWNTLEHQEKHTCNSYGIAFAWSQGPIRQWLLQSCTKASPVLQARLFTLDCECDSCDKHVKPNHMPRSWAKKDKAACSSLWYQIGCSEGY